MTPRWQLINAQPSIFISETLLRNAALELMGADGVWWIGLWSTTTLGPLFGEDLLSGRGRIGLLPDRPRVRDEFLGGDLEFNLDLLLNADFEGALVLDLPLVCGGMDWLLFLADGRISTSAAVSPSDVAPPYDKNVLTRLHLGVVIILVDRGIF